MFTNLIEPCIDNSEFVKSFFKKIKNENDHSKLANYYDK